MSLAINTNTPITTGPSTAPDASVVSGVLNHLTDEVRAANDAIAGGASPKAATKTLLAKMFDDVRAYGLVGLWSLTNAEMRNISNTQDVQQSLMDLEQVVETLSTNWSNYWTGKLQTDENTVQDYADPTHHTDWSDQKRAAEVSAATSQYNFDSTNMQTFGSFFSSLNNLLSNGVSNAGQNLSTDGSTIQQVVMKIMDSLSQLLGSV